MIPGTGFVIWPVVSSGDGCDTNWGNVVFLLNGASATDSSDNATSVTNTGISIVDGAYQCVGTGQLDTTDNDADFDMFLVDSTIEFFLERTASAYGAIFGQGSGYNLIGMSVSGPLDVVVATATVMSIAVPSADVNHHIEITHRASDRYMEMYVDGEVAATGTATGTAPGGMDMTWFGEAASGSPPQLGRGGAIKIRGVRITRGIIRHTSDFEAPAAPFAEVAC